MDDVKERVLDHDKKLVKIETILERVATNQDSLTQSMRDISKSMQKQELLLEKLTNLEINTKESINRLHKRIDYNSEKLKLKADTVVVEDCVEKLKTLEPIIFFTKRPKLLILMILGFTSLLFKEVRDFVFTIIGIY